MQFYQVHKCPFLNVYSLPEYAVLRVNVREGWQILSDIGHFLNITWEGQNKPYSLGHPATVKQRRDKESFRRFLAQYKACLHWYKVLTWSETVFHERIKNVPEEEILHRILFETLTEEQASISYLIDFKSKFITEKEKEKLLRIF